MKIQKQTFWLSMILFCVYELMSSATQAAVTEIIGEFPATENYRITRVNVQYDSTSLISEQKIKELYEGHNLLKDNNINVKEIQTEYQKLFTVKLLSQHAVSLEFDYQKMKQLFHFDTGKIRNFFSKQPLEFLDLIQPIMIELDITTPSKLTTTHTIRFDKFYGGHVYMDTSLKQQEGGFRHSYNSYVPGQIRLTLK